MKNSTTLFHFILLFCLIGSCQLTAQKSLDQSLQNLFNSHYGASPTAVATLISVKRVPLFEYYHGNTSIKNQKQVESTTLFLIGSLTKQFTATAILLLEEQGLLSTEDFLEDFLPQFNQKTYPVSIHHLLTHTAGIPFDNAARDIQKRITEDLSPQQRIQFLEGMPLLFTPGEQYDYSNNGYLILGLIIEKVSGLSYSEFLQKHIFQPIQMKQSQVLENKKSLPNQAIGYFKNDQDELETAPVHASTFSAGGILSTSGDLNKWATALFSHQIISEKSLAKMLQNYSLPNGKKLNLGYGWEINTIGNQTSYEHSGFEPGYKCYSIFLPKKGIYVLTCQNTEEGSPRPISIQAAAIAAGDPYPDETQVIALPETQTGHFTGTYLFDNSQERMIGLSDQGLYIMAPGGLKQPLKAINNQTLIYKNGYRKLAFSHPTDSGFTKVLYSNRIQTSKGLKISNQVPTESIAIALPLETLQTYTGLYESKIFNITISIDGGNLFAQPEGSDRLQLIPTAKNKFFIQEIGAEIDFEVTDGEAPKQIKILLEGQLMVGVRKME